MVWSVYRMCIYVCFCVFKQKTAYEVRISDWSSDVCSSDLSLDAVGQVMSDSAPNLRPALDGVARISESVNRRDDMLRTLLSDANDVAGTLAERGPQEIGRASCRERVCQYV